MGVAPNHLFCLILWGFSITNHPSGYPHFRNMYTIYTRHFFRPTLSTQVNSPRLWFHCYLAPNYPAPIRPQREFLQGSRSGTRRSNSPTKRLSEGSLVLGKFKAHVRSFSWTPAANLAHCWCRTSSKIHTPAAIICHMPSSRFPNPCWRPSKSFGPGTLALNHTKKPYQVRPPGMSVGLDLPHVY